MAELHESRVFARIGEEGFDALTRAFYTRVEADDLLAPMYPAADFEGARLRLREFLVYRFGGPDRYIQERGHPRLRGRHMPFPIDEAARDRWVKLMDEAIDEAAIEHDVVTCLRPFFAQTATFMRNR